MAIEVISRRHPSAIKIVVCRNCGAELQYTNADVRVHTTTDYTGCKETDKVINCPDCRRIVMVNGR